MWFLLRWTVWPVLDTLKKRADGTFSDVFQHSEHGLFSFHPFVVDILRTCCYRRRRKHVRAEPGRICLDDPPSVDALVWARWCGVSACSMMDGWQLPCRPVSDGRELRGMALDVHVCARPRRQQSRLFGLFPERPAASWTETNAAVPGRCSPLVDPGTWLIRRVQLLIPVRRRDELVKRLHEGALAG